MINVDYDSDGNIYNVMFGNGAVHQVHESEARSLIRGLVDAGVSMTLPDTSYTAGELEATKSHLNDLRRIVFEDLRMTKDD